MAKNELESKLADSLTINSELSCVIKTLESDKEILSEQLKHKVESCDLLTEELKSLRAEAESVRKLKVDALFKLEEVAGREGSLKVVRLKFFLSSLDSRKPLVRGNRCNAAPHRLA